MPDILLMPLLILQGILYCIFRLILVLAAKIWLPGAIFYYLALAQRQHT